MNLKNVYRQVKELRARDNYWSDYDGTDDFWDVNQDLKGYELIGDTPYSIYGVQDRYLLMILWRVRSAHISNSKTSS